jgi:small subunit ribosomal protein S3
MGAGALGVEITISGKLRGERAHFEKHTAGIIPKSGKFAEEVVRSSTNSMLTKMGLVGIKLKISIKEEVHRDFDLEADSQPKSQTEIPTKAEGIVEKQVQSETTEQNVPAESEVKTEIIESKENMENTENTESKDIIDNEVKEIAVNKSEK